MGRQWHALVGSSMTIMMCLRIGWPHFYELLKLPLRDIYRRWKSQSIPTQELMNDLYQHPQFNLAEAYAETVATVTYALIFSPAIPALNPIAAMGLAGRYLCDWIIFLRGSSRPPFYDEHIVYTVINWLLVGLGLHALTLMITILDQAYFPVYGKEGCGVPLDDVAGLREEDHRSIYKVFGGSMGAMGCTGLWTLPALIMMFAWGARIMLPYIP